MQRDDRVDGDEQLASSRVVGDIHELVELVELEDVFLWEERSRRIDETKTEGDEVPRVRNVMNVADRADGLGIGFRFRMTFDDRQGNEFIADLQAQYETPERLEVSQELRTEFAERVAFFTVYPYLRASIQTAAARMGVPAPVLAIVRAGQFKLGSPMSADAAANEFEDRAPEE
ncbi:hypothetical protein [Curtobacterium sp. Leaf154]|uniref:hypothetical protein n=1 Tax=Curtobacterium sp. Leaf154 TaxID=1736277 RepID=UPI0006FBE742|nr:hypothetical protein [Curtobacterium sp. Leaf154]KQR31101.1 hypothetical protein ASF75_06620 [Curtobacterium sp. Leaf154]